jgi:hypothetical protein
MEMLLDAAAGGDLWEGVMRKLNVELMATKVKHWTDLGAKERRRWQRGGKGRGGDGASVEEEGGRGHTAKRWTTGSSRTKASRCSKRLRTST